MQALLPTLFVTLVSSTVPGLPPAPFEDGIQWRSDLKLVEQDFQAEVPTAQERSETGVSQDSVASTHVELGMTYAVQGSQVAYQIRCRFLKSRSWLQLTAQDLPYILAHEQGHFDISELYARRMHREARAYLASGDPSGAGQALTAIFNRAAADEKTEQQKYDGDTGNSRDRVEQARWLEKIRKSLDETAADADYPRP